MNTTLPDDRADAEVDRLAAEYLAAAERGQAPNPAEWLARHPAHAAELAAFLADLGLFAPLLGLHELPTDLDQTTDLQSVPAPGNPTPAGESFDVFELTALLGRGGMGEVYRATRTGTRLVVALKRLRAGVGADEARRFKEEAEAVLGLQHDHIVKVYHVGEHDGRPYFTMRLAEGGSLDRHAGRYQHDPRAAVRLMIKVARAVHHAHQRQVVHRDLKPANILLDEAGEPLVADFGLAARLSGGAADAEAAGSLPWMAPEAVRGEAVTTGVDVWGIGAILYELLTGRRAFPQQTRGELRAAILEQTPPPVRALNPGLDADLGAVCARCLAKDPGARYESASAVALDLERWLRDEPVRARKPTRRERVARWLRRNPATAAGAALLVTVLFTVAVAALSVAREQDERVRAEVCRGNEYAAKGVAASVLWRLGELGDEVIRAADDPRLHAHVARGDWNEVRGFLAERQRASARTGTDRPAFVTVYLLDPEGTIRAEFPPGQVENKNYRGRDYFHRALGYADRIGRDRVHVSRVFTSENDGLDKLALSVPFRPGGPGGPVWVLGATITTGPSLGLDNLHDGPRQTVLIAARDTNDPHQPPPPPRLTEYVVLVHQGYAPGQVCVPFRGGTPRPATAPPDEPELQFPGRGASFEPDAAFADPLVGGRWLAGSAPVGNTELVVLVAQRDDAAVTPHRSFFGRILAWIGGAVAVALAAVGAVRLVRRSRSDMDPAGTKT